MGLFWFLSVGGLLMLLCCGLLMNSWICWFWRFLMNILIWLKVMLILCLWKLVVIFVRILLVEGLWLFSLWMWKCSL